MSSADVLRCPLCGAAFWTFMHQCYDESLISNVADTGDCE